MNRRREIVIALSAGALAVPLGAFAQQKDKIWRVGFLSPSTAALSSGNTGAFLQGMRELGYFEGKNLVVEWGFADGKLERLPGLAAELVKLKVDVIVVASSQAISAAQKATTTIPIVMTTTGDPIGGGFVKSLARPGGNITGLSTITGDSGAKLFELLLSVVPKMSRLGVLVSSGMTFRSSDGAMRKGPVFSEAVLAVTQKAGVKALVVEALTAQEIENAFSMMVREKVDAVIVGSPTIFAQHRRQIVDLATKYRIPSMFEDRANVDAGGLISYGQNRTENYLRAAAYVDKILKGAKPADLPVEQPLTLELVVNLKTAKALGLTIPQTILLRAKEVIE
jgi:putative ABC transport system substrate-binding protein